MDRQIDHGQTDDSHSEYELILTDDGGNVAGEQIHETPIVESCPDVESAPIVYDDSGTPKFYAVVVDGGMTLVPIEGSNAQPILNSDAFVATADDDAGCEERVIYVESQPEVRVMETEEEIVDAWATRKYEEWRTIVMRDHDYNALEIEVETNSILNAAEFGSREITDGREGTYVIVEDPETGRIRFF